MKASIIIPHLNVQDSLLQCLLSLNQQTLDRSAYEIIVVDNGSTHFNASAYEGLANHIVAYTESKDPYNCRNVGIAMAKADIIVFLDAKCIPDSTWLEEGIACINSDYDLVGGHFDITNQIDLYTKSYQLMYLDNFQLDQVKAGFPGGNIFVRKRIVDDVGLFHINVRSGEDIRWTSAIIKKGYKSCYCSSARVTYAAKNKSQTRIGALRDGLGRRKSGMGFSYRMLLPMNPRIFHSKINRFSISLTPFQKVLSYLYIWQIRLYNVYGYLCG